MLLVLKIRTVNRPHKLVLKIVKNISHILVLKFRALEQTYILILIKRDKTRIYTCYWF